MDYIHDGVDSHSYLCKTVFLVRGLNTCKISVNYDYWYMYNVQTMVLVYRVLIRGGWDHGGPRGHLEWQVLRAPQYVNPDLNRMKFLRQQPTGQNLKFGKFKMADGRHIENTFWS